MSDADFDARYPEHAKTHALKAQSEGIFDFLQWAADKKGLRFGRSVFDDDEGEVFIEAGDYALREVLAEYFKVDLDRLETEKRQMLDELRGHNASN
jgi:hypothetical protein